MIYPFNTFRKKTSIGDEDAGLPCYEVSMWTEKPFCPKCGSDKKISVDHTIERPINGFDMVQDEPAKVSVIDACFFRCHNTDLCTRFQDPWIPFGAGNQKYSLQYYQYLVDTYLLDGLTIKEIKDRFFKEISRPLSDAISNCRKAINSYLACSELWFIQISYLGDDRCIVLGIPADGGNIPVLLTVCASPVEIGSFSRKIQTDRIKTIACECELEYFDAIQGAFFPQPDASGIQVIWDSSPLKVALEKAKLSDRNKTKKKYEELAQTRIENERKTKKRLSQLDVAKHENYFNNICDDVLGVLETLQKAIEKHYTDLIEDRIIQIGNHHPSLFQVIEAKYQNDWLCKNTCKFEDFETEDFPAVYQVAKRISLLTSILKAEKKAKGNCKIVRDTAANALRKDVIDRLQKFEANKFPFDVAVLKLCFHVRGQDNFHRRLNENSIYADFLKKCFEQRRTVEANYHKFMTPDQIAFASEAPNAAYPAVQIAMADFFSAMAPHRELEFYAAMLRHLQQNHAGDIHISDELIIPDWEMIVAEASVDITPWQYPPIWKDVHTVIPIDLEKV